MRSLQPPLTRIRAYEVDVGPLTFFKSIERKCSDSWPKRIYERDIKQAETLLSLLSLFLSSISALSENLPRRGRSPNSSLIASSGDT